MLKEHAAFDDLASAFAGASRPLSALDAAIARAKTGLLRLQHPDGHWVFPLEADCTIPAEYILMMHFMDEIDGPVQGRIANFLRSRQSDDGGYPLYPGGPGEISCTIKAYYALKLAGDAVDDPHMGKARIWILARGGAARANVFTRIMLAMFGQVPWRAVPFIPVEIMLLPRWFPFHLTKVAYWSRTVMVPLSILCTYKVTARNPRKIGVRELFVNPPEQETAYFSHVKTRLGRCILALERVGRCVEPLIPALVRRKATARARDWFMARLNGYDGLGGIFTAMVNAYEAMDYLGVPKEDERRQIAKAAIARLLVTEGDRVYCQPCVSPVWDTGLVTLALQEVDRNEREATTGKALEIALDWLVSRQLRDEPGDWRVCRPNLAGGGWAFQFGNSYYPDVDDTAVVAIALIQAGNPAFSEPIDRAGTWIAGMQSANGGYGAFDADNTYHYLNHVPFADHGALLDPPTADVSGRCVMFLSALTSRSAEFRPVIERCIEYLRTEQEPDGSWFGRWGTNYIYGTWSVLAGFEAAGLSPQDPSIVRSVSWLKAKQGADGGWGEVNASYRRGGSPLAADASTPFHTAIAILALLAAGELGCREIESGVGFLLKQQQTDGFWNDAGFNAPGFPEVFYLKYHGYDKVFPLWALARYRNACSEKRRDSLRPFKRLGHVPRAKIVAG